ncbi:MAG: hypothetical protein M1831_004713 [Alyxoria varia]|nr:MAG: hypothetical protein M1831_004713 [Alyxoria varia]
MRRMKLFYQLLLLCTCRLCRADPPTFNRSAEFDSGELGIYVELSFNSSDLRAPQLNIQQWSDGCDSDDSYYFLTPRGLLVGRTGPTILDSHGHMIWRREDFGMTYDFKVQRYKDQDVLTFWSGDDTVVGHGSGFQYILDPSYRQIAKIQPHGNLTADLHDFVITDRDTAIITSYQKVSADLSYYGKSRDGWIWDCLFQEIVIDTNELLFEWRATDYFQFEDCYHEPPPGAGTEENAFDYYHINSVDKDRSGNYIVSARYSHAVTCIDGKTGDILWHLGGKNNTFSDLSEGTATNFKWQHDARWRDRDTAISLFDNSAYFDDNVDAARGIIVALDPTYMTAELAAEYRHPKGYIAESQGSLQILSNGNALMGYGHVPAWTEYSPNGDVLCDIRYGALHYNTDGSFSPGAVQSYRTYKQSWKGHPLEAPKIKFNDGTFFVSWNGATEVKWWQLEGKAALDFVSIRQVGKNWMKSIKIVKHGDAYASAEGSKEWQELGLFERQGFESALEVPTRNTEQNAHLAYRLTAMDRTKHVLGIWNVDSGGAVWPHDSSLARFTSLVHSKQPHAAMWTVAVTMCLLVLFTCRKLLFRLNPFKACSGKLIVESSPMKKKKHFLSSIFASSRLHRVKEKRDEDGEAGEALIGVRPSEVFAR